MDCPHQKSDSLGHSLQTCLYDLLSSFIVLFRFIVKAQIANVTLLYMRDKDEVILT